MRSILDYYKSLDAAGAMDDVAIVRAKPKHTTRSTPPRNPPPPPPPAPPPISHNTKVDDNTLQTTIVAFTDGSFTKRTRERPFPLAGYAVVFPDYPKYNVGEKLTASTSGGVAPTNNRAEFMALVRCIERSDDIDPTRKRTLTVHIDSTYVIDCIDKWISGWKKNGWKAKDGSPVKNVDLIKRIDEMRRHRRVVLRHVRAHTGKDDYHSKWNDVADKAAKAAAQLSGRSQK